MQERPLVHCQQQLLPLCHLEKAAQLWVSPEPLLLPAAAGQLERLLLLQQLLLLPPLPPPLLQQLWSSCF
jgi:hypothetical protein